MPDGVADMQRILADWAAADPAWLLVLAQYDDGLAAYPQPFQPRRPPMPAVRLSDRIAEHRYTRDGMPGVRHNLWCPGCQDVHAITVEGTETWTWDGNAEAPTYSPSLLAKYGTIAGERRRCHSFIVGGQWQFLTDSTHALAGQTVPMVPFPEEYL